MQALSKQQLEEVRSLQCPSPILQKTLGLVYCLLYPEKVVGVKGIDGLPWKQKLAPMLKRDDLIRKLIDFPPAHTTQPLLAYPAVAALIESNVSDDVGVEVPESVPNASLRVPAAQRGPQRRPAPPCPPL